MADPRVFLACSFPDKKWLDRVQTALTPFVPQENTLAWDERKLQHGNTWRTDLAAALGRSKLVLILVSGLFLESDFIRRARLPALLKKARAEGVVVRWILVSHCQHEAAGFAESDAMNPLDSPLDAISTARREAVLAQIGRQVEAVLNDRTYEPPVAVEPAEEPLTAARLGAVVVARTRTVILLRRLRTALLPFALAMFVLAGVVAVMRESLAELLLVAGYGIFALTLARLVGSRAAFLDQSLVGLRCVRTGLGDDTLPERQRGDLARRAKEILGD